MPRQGRKCTVCSRPDVQTVNKALVKRKASIRRVAADFGIPETNLRRHFRNDVPKTVEAAKAQDQEAREGFDILRWIEEDRQAIEEVRTRAEAAVSIRTRDGKTEEFADPDDRMILESIKASARLIEVAAKVQGDIPSEVGTVKVTLSMDQRAEEVG